MALMAIERAAATPVILIKRNKPNDALPAGMKPRSPQTTNTERKLADLELAVTEGLMTAREAYRAFGRKLPGTGGRRRAPGQEDFRAWLVRRIDKLSDPSALQKLAERVAQAREDRTLSHGNRVALVREMNRRSWQYDPEYVERLRAALAELDGCGSDGPELRVTTRNRGVSGVHSDLAAA
jgi:hypothetical protein